MKHFWQNIDMLDRVWSGLGLGLEGNCGTKLKGKPNRK